jgi:hypothetical protein
MKARQRSKIKEIGDALVTAGLLTLDAQANMLGLCRSTTWSVLQANYKTSGLSATIINRMLAAPRLDPIVRAKILEYVEEKTAGLYGDSKTRLRRFTASLSINGVGDDMSPSNRTPKVGTPKGRLAGLRERRAGAYGKLAMKLRSRR